MRESSGLERALGFLLRAQVCRHAAVLLNMLRARRFLARAPAEGGTRTRCVVVLPMLLEQRLAAETVAYFASMLRDGDHITIVTAEREGSGPGSTPALAASVADGQRIRHLHLADVQGAKGDQINLAVRKLADELAAAELHGTLVVVYDADSRPPVTSLEYFAAEAERHPGVDVFHQSAQFEVREARSLVAAAHALRANRFVLAYELPRLLGRSPCAGGMRRMLARVTYGHVTGHGLALRAGAALCHPLPSRTPMEDMVYSFDLAVRGVPVQPIRSLDRSEVTVSQRQQFLQNERWFAGPGRALRYRSSTSGPTRNLVTLSAMLICLEWLSCAVALPVTLRRAAAGDRGAQAFLTLYLAELLVTDRRLGAIALYPVANTLFGLAAWSSIIKTVLRRPLAVKTERRM